MKVNTLQIIRKSAVIHSAVNATHTKKLLDLLEDGYRSTERLKLDLANRFSVEPLARKRR